MKPSGIILKLNPKQAIVMTHEAAFITIRRQPGMYVGARVELNQPSPQGFPFLRQGALVALSAMVILIGAFLFTMYNFREDHLYAYVTVDINPSVEFTVNENIQVVETRDLNTDARRLTGGIDFKDMPLTQALSTLVNQAEQKHYLNNAKDAYLLVSAVPLKASREKPELLKTSIATVKADLASRKIQMHYIEATLDQRKAAISQHLSTGRYALSDYAKQTGHSMEIQTAKTKDIVTLLDQAGILKKAEKPKTTTPGNSVRKSKDRITNNANKPALLPTSIGNSQGNGFNQPKDAKKDPKVPKPDGRGSSTDSDPGSKNNQGGDKSNGSDSLKQGTRDSSNSGGSDQSSGSSNSNSGDNNPDKSKK